jgi:hypothetical protein
MNKMLNLKNYIQTFIFWYFTILLFLYAAIRLNQLYLDTIIFYNFVDTTNVVFMLKESSQPMLNVVTSYTPQKVLNYPLLTIDKAQQMSLQDKITYTLALMDINLLLGFDLKGFSNGLYGILHVGVEASTLSQNTLINSVNPYAIVLKIPISFIHANIGNIDEVRESVNQWVLSMQPCQIKTMLNVTQDSCYGLPKLSSFATKMTILQTDKFSVSFALQIPFEHIDNPKKYGFGCSFNIY